MKKILAIILATVMLFGCGTSVFAAKNIDIWAEETIEQEFEIIDVNINMTEPAPRIYCFGSLYKTFEMLGETKVDISNIPINLNDINNLRPYSTERNAVSWLYVLGVLKGDDKGNANPNGLITRAEWNSLLVRVLKNQKVISANKKPDIKNPYQDEGIENHWGYEDILLATEVGLVQGDGRNFNPNNLISKQEVLIIFIRLCNMLDLSYEDTAEIITDTFGIEVDSKVSSIEEGKYTVVKGKTEKVYAVTGKNIKSYSVTSGSSYVTITKQTGYLKVTGRAIGTAKIKITDTSGNSDTVTVKVTSSNSSYDDYYEIEKNDYDNVYAPSGENIRTYSITSGSSYITVSKYTSYLKVTGKKEGTAKIKITDTDGNVDTVTVDVVDHRDGYAYGLTKDYEIERGQYKNLYFEYLGDIDDYDVSRTGIVSVIKNTGYLKVYGGSTGSVTITGYDEDGNSEKIKVVVEDNDDEYDNAYGLTDEYEMEEGDYQSISFEYLDELEDYELSKSGIVSVTLYDNYIRVYAKSAGTVTITGYDYNGNSEKIRITVDGEYDNDYDYGVTDTITMYNDDEQKVYFHNLYGDIEDYEVSKSGMVYVELHDNYIIVEGRTGKSGTVTITVYDEYGASETVKVKVYERDDSEPPYRDVIYPPDYEIDISK